MSEDNLSPYQQVGEKLIKAGICALPVVPGTKVPGKYTGGYWARMPEWTKRYANALPNILEVRSFNNAPNAGVCAVLGQASGNLVAVDIDVGEAIKDVVAVLPSTPLMKKGQKGLTLFYRSTLPSKVFDRVNPDGTRIRLLDFLAEGRQTVLPPTIHPDTRQPYRWSGELDLENARLSDVPWLHEDAIERIEKALERHGYKKDAEPRRKAISNGASHEPVDDTEITVFRELNNLALHRLCDWVPALSLYKCIRTPAGYEAVATWRESCTGQIPEKRKRNLKFSRSGIKDFGADVGYTAIDLVMAANETDFDRAYAWLSHMLGKAPSELIGEDLISSFSLEDEDIKDEIKEELKQELKNINSDIKPWRREAIPEQGEATATVEAPRGAKDYQGIDITKCPGLVGEIASWIVSTAEFQQPLLSIGSALAIVGVVCSRQIQGPTQSGTHLYIAGIAPTGSGKDWPRAAITNILGAAGMANLVGPGKFTSDSAINNALSNNARLVSCIDEIGQFLSRGKSRSASTHEAGISANLRELWSAGHGLKKMTGRANADAISLYSPALTIYGVSTAGELFDNLRKEDIHNGLLNRFLILKNDVRPEPADPGGSRADVPESIISGLQAIKERLGTLADSQFSGAGTNQLTAEPHRVPWANDDVKKAFSDMQKSIAREMDEIQRKEPFMARTAEMSLRIATIRAVGIDSKNPSVTMEDLSWAEALVRDSVDDMFGEAEEKIVENDFERKQTRVLAYMASAQIKDKKSAGILKGLILRNMGLGTKAKELDDILVNLIAHGLVERIGSDDSVKDGRRKHKFKLSNDALMEWQGKLKR